MKKVLIHILLVSLMIFFSGCQDYLETIPDSSLNVEIDSEEKIAELLTGAYPQASYFSFLETRTDNVAPRENGEIFSLNEAMYKWSDLYTQDDLDSPLHYWNSCYSGIAHANKALELLAKFPKTDRVKALYGEAFLIRAYLHFMVVNIWAEPYKGERSKNDMGIPYVTTPEKNALVNYDRTTVYQVYENIEKDLRRGITLVDDSFYEKPKFHFNKRSAYAFATRFYLFKAEWDNVIAYADYALDGSPKEVLRNWRSYYSKYRFTNPELEFERYTSVQEPANLLIATTESRIARELPRQKYGLTRSMISDLDFYSPSRCDAPINNGIYISKFDEFSLSGDTGIRPKGLFVSNILFSTDEVMLNRMEAYVMKRNYDQAVLEYIAYQKIKFDKELNANERLKLLTTSDENYQKYAPYYGLTIKQLAFIQNVLKERRKEFLHEGLRWFDIRRFYIPVNRTSLPLKKEDLRKIMQLPIEAIKQGLPANPR